MRAGVIHHASGRRYPKPLVVRGGLVRTFGGLAGFLVVTFLFGGLYILEDAFANPLDAGAAPVISGAFIIALAVMLLFFLIKPRKRPRTTTRHHSFDSAVPAGRPSADQAGGAECQAILRNNLSYQRFYVDHSRVRP